MWINYALNTLFVLLCHNGCCLLLSYVWTASVDGLACLHWQLAIVFICNVCCEFVRQINLFPVLSSYLYHGNVLINVETNWKTFQLIRIRWLAHIIIIIIICVYYDMTVEHQYSTLKNEKLHRYNIARSSNNQYTFHNLIHNLTSQYNSIM